MYKDDDTMTPRDRISEDMLRRILGSSEETANGRAADYARTPDCTGNTDRIGGKERHTWGLENYPLASVYAPLQEFHELYDRDAALKHGTVFAELDLPFMGETVSKGGRNHV